MITDSEKIRKRVEDRREAAGISLRKAIVDTLSTDSGRRLWLWVRDELCRATKRAPVGGHPSETSRFEGRRDVGLDMDARLATFPELRIELARARAEIEVADAANEADLERLKAEEKTDAR